MLRDNNLVVEARHAGRLFYSRTPLGEILIGDVSNSGRSGR
ncbi:hypothetical protein [Pseudonocardia sp. TRM90224]|nr:hypothetical protein [Pseudonocardia sp. TRM90224]